MARNRLPPQKRVSLLQRLIGCFHPVELVVVDTVSGHENGGGDRKSGMLHETALVHNDLAFAADTATQTQSYSINPHSAGQEPVQPGPARAQHPPDAEGLPLSGIPSAVGLPAGVGAQARASPSQLWGLLAANASTDTPDLSSGPSSMLAQCCSFQATSAFMVEVGAAASCKALTPSALGALAGADKA